MSSNPFSRIALSKRSKKPSADLPIQNNRYRLLILVVVFFGVLPLIAGAVPEDYLEESAPSAAARPASSFPTGGGEAEERRSFPTSPASSSVTPSTAEFLDFSDTASATPFPEMDPVTGTIRILASLGIVIALILGVSWFLQKRVGFSAHNLGKVHGIIPLDNKRFLYVVEVLGKVMILGVTEQSINHLSDVSEPEALAMLRVDHPDAGTSHLAGMFDFLKRKSPESEQSTGLAESEVLRERTDRTQQKLQRMRELLVQHRQDKSSRD